MLATYLPFVELTGEEVTSVPLTIVLDSTESHGGTPRQLLAMIFDALVADLQTGGPATDTLLRYLTEEDVSLPQCRCIFSRQNIKYPARPSQYHCGGAFNFK